MRGKTGVSASFSFRLSPQPSLHSWRKGASEGANWKEINSGLSNLKVRSLTVSESNLFAGTYGGGIFLSTNYRTSWMPVNSELTNLYVNSLCLSGSKIFAGTKWAFFFLPIAE